MKIVYNSLIPFKGFNCINIFGILFVRNEYKEQPILGETVTHEAIHTKQMQEMGYLLFYILYFVEWLVRLIILGVQRGKYSFKDCCIKAYYNVSFEREAYLWQSDYSYLASRKHYAWLKYLKK